MEGHVPDAVQPGWLRESVKTSRGDRRDIWAVCRYVAELLDGDSLAAGDIGLCGDVLDRWCEVAEEFERLGGRVGRRRLRRSRACWCRDRVELAFEFWPPFLE